ncbi:MAG: hypothetical protein ACOY3Z_05430 [Thermodesulfobacteriota bacterium]
MTTFKDEWDLTMALEVLGSQTVDSRLWADAVKWLLLFGPPEVRQVIAGASSMATGELFPELSPSGYTDDGEPLYDTAKLAESLGMSEEELLERMAELEEAYQVRGIYAGNEAHKVQ